MELREGVRFAIPFVASLDDSIEIDGEKFNEWPIDLPEDTKFTLDSASKRKIRRGDRGIAKLEILEFHTKNKKLVGAKILDLEADEDGRRYRYNSKRDNITDLEDVYSVKCPHMCGEEYEYPKNTELRSVKFRRVPPEGWAGPDRYTSHFYCDNCNGDIYPQYDYRDE